MSSPLELNLNSLTRDKLNIVLQVINKALGIADSVAQHCFRELYNYRLLAK
jgi:hypothetical protein